MPLHTKICRMFHPMRCLQCIITLADLDSISLCYLYYLGAGLFRKVPGRPGVRLAGICPPRLYTWHHQVPCQKSFSGNLSIYHCSIYLSIYPSIYLAGICPPRLYTWHHQVSCKKSFSGNLSIIVFIHLSIYLSFPLSIYLSGGDIRLLQVSKVLW